MPGTGNALNGSYIWWAYDIIEIEGVWIMEWYPWFSVYGHDSNRSPCRCLPDKGYTTDLNVVLPLLREAVQDERNDELFYDYLIQNAPSAEDREVITAIRNDERRHRKMFR